MPESDIRPHRPERVRWTSRGVAGPLSLTSGRLRGLVLRQQSRHLYQRLLVVRVLDCSEGAGNFESGSRVLVHAGRAASF